MSPSIVTDWKLSKHSQAGVDCSTCHGDQHTTDADGAKALIPTPETGVRPMQRNPRASDNAPDSAIRRAQEEFNDCYCAILRMLDQAFSGSPRTLGLAVGCMYRLKAQALMEMPTEDGRGTAGPTFEHVPRRPPTPRWALRIEPRRGAG